MSTVTTCTCGHLISEHTYSDDKSGCDKCFCKLNLGELIDKYAKEVADRTEQNLKDLIAVEANYDALQSPMPCGHLARYAVNEEEGTQYCALCVLEADRQTITNLVMVDVEETNEKCPFCQTRAILTRVEELLDLTPEIGSKHYDDVIADLINGASSAKSTFQCYCEETNHE